MSANPLRHSRPELDFGPYKVASVDFAHKLVVHDLQAAMSRQTDGVVRLVRDDNYAIAFQPSRVVPGYYIGHEGVPYHEALELSRNKVLMRELGKAGFVKSSGQMQRAWQITTSKIKASSDDLRVEWHQAGNLNCYAGNLVTHCLEYSNGAKRERVYLEVQHSVGHEPNVFVIWANPTPYLADAVLVVLAKMFDGDVKKVTVDFFQSYCVIGNPSLNAHKPLSYPLLARTSANENVLAWYEAAFNAASAEGRQVCFAPNVVGVGAQALVKQCQDSTKWRVIASEGVSQRVAKLYPVNQRVDMLDSGSLGPELPLDAVVEVMGNSNVRSAIEPLRFKTWGALSKMVLPQLREFGYHGDSAIDLEDDRVLGKKVAKWLGFNVLPYVLIERADQIDLIEQIKGSKLVLKYNTLSFIGIYARNAVPSILKSALELGPIVVEEWVPTVSEVNFSFLVHDSTVTPMCELVETNRLLGNNTGGKGGTVWSAHRAYMGKHRDPSWKPLLDAAKKMQRINTFLAELHQGSFADDQRYIDESMDDGVCGWIDASFMVTNKGELYFTEWMVRNGCSNFITLLHQMKMPYPELVHRNATGEKINPSEVWRNAYSFGVELYTVPLSSGCNMTSYETNAMRQYIDSDRKGAITMDLLEECALTDDGESYQVGSGGRRIGVVSLRTDRINRWSWHPDEIRLTAEDSHQYRKVLDQATSELPYSGYRFIGK